MTYHLLPSHLHPHVLAHQYYPYFGRIDTARIATVGINCGPAEACQDRLGFRRDALDLTRDLVQQTRCLHDTGRRPLRYFDTNTSPPPDLFWNFFHPGGAADENPLHREHYFSGGLAHVDVTPWATREVWSAVEPAVQNELLNLGRPVLVATLEAATNLRCLVVRGKTAAHVVAEAFGVELPPMQSIGGRYRTAEIYLQIKGRALPVVAINQFQNISGDAARALVERVRAHVQLSV